MRRGSLRFESVQLMLENSERIWAENVFTDFALISRLVWPVEPVEGDAMPYVSRLVARWPSELLYIVFTLCGTASALRNVACTKREVAPSGFSKPEIVEYVFRKSSKVIFH